MATFQYIAMDAQGKEQKGTVDAADRAQAIAAVRAAGLFPSAIGEVKSAAPAAAGKKPATKKAAAPAKKGGSLNKDIKINIKLPSFLQGRVKPKDLTTFTRQLATLVNAGLPLMRCIEVLKKQNQIPAMGACLNGISESISGHVARSISYSIVIVLVRVFASKGLSSQLRSGG